ncbi:MAG TPA: ABC-three component system protein [Candidatus Binatia bacterium]|nr:ABC-three component system protein [Candidatus Binatia bacterium]
MSSPFSAAGPTQGTLFQIRYALWLLVKAAHDDPTVSIRVEGSDDIEVVRDKGSDLIQTKHHAPSVPVPLTDQSSDLWKTLRVWSELTLADSTVLESTLFTLVTTATTKTNDVVHKIAEGRNVSFSDASGIAQRLTAISESGGNKKNRPGYQAFLSLSAGDRARLIQHVRIIDATPSNINISKQLQDALRSTVTGKPQLKALVERLEGWWNSRVASNLQTSGDQITAEELFAEIRDTADSLGPEALPRDEEALAYKALLSINEALIYVRQLRLLEYRDSVILRAITDFVRTQRQISVWMREELLLVNELPRYKQKLFDEWQLRFDFMLDAVQGVTDVHTLIDRGRALYESIIQQSLPIRHDWLDSTIMRGCYHDLADHHDVGWHPHYKELL